jgi:glycine/D-amino acid oxidase-like deaminating enzyme/nitrite reductase/ring-hydroxylating ferredoxin subunit
MKTQSEWRLTDLPHFERVENNGECDVAVIGGGVMGLTTAYLLKRAGRRVCVLERDELGAGDTGNTSAHLTYVTDLSLPELVKTFGKEEARLVWQGGEVAIGLIESIVEREGIECDFKRVPGFYHAPLSQSDDERAELQEIAALAADLGFLADYLPTAPSLGRPAVKCADQARIHPLKYLGGLARAIEGDGSRVFTQTEVTEVTTDPLRVKAGQFELRCNYVVIGTHVPLMGKAGVVSSSILQSKLSPYTSYVLTAELPTGTHEEGLFWDTADPYEYLRVDREAERDLVVFGGQDHKTGQVEDTEEQFRKLENALQRRLPGATVLHRWSGQVVETNDGLPYIGEVANQQFSATGFSGNGLTLGTLAALMACDAALWRKNPWQDLLSVNRTKVRGGLWDYLKENADYPYQLLKGWLTGRNARSLSQVGPGEGKVLLLHGHNVACSRDQDAKAVCVSAVCPHLGCLVGWNKAEKTWDCPCHGSRFRADGSVLAGPAESPLEVVDVS